MKRVEHLAFRYDQRGCVFDDLTIEFRSHAVSYIVGASGAGKTTLALLLAGELDPEVGSIFPSDSAALVMQFPEMLFLEHSLNQEARSLATLEEQSRVRQYLNGFGVSLEQHGEQSPERFSFAQRRLIGIALQAARSAGTLVLDEPTLGLDEDNLQKVGDFIDTESKTREEVVVITHDLELVQNVPGDVCILANCGCAWYGASTEFMVRRDLWELANAS